MHKYIDESANSEYDGSCYVNVTLCGCFWLIMPAGINKGVSATVDDVTVFRLTC